VGLASSNILQVDKYSAHTRVRTSQWKYDKTRDAEAPQFETVPTAAGLRVFEAWVRRSMGMGR